MAYDTRELLARLIQCEAGGEGEQTANRAHNTQNDTDPKDPASPAVAAAQPGGQEYKSGRRQCDTEPQLGKPNDQV